MNVEESELHAAKLIEREAFPAAELILTSLADQGSTYAMMALAWIYENGCLGDKNITASQYYYERASFLGRIDADFRLGHLLLENGRDSEARRVFQRGSDRGHLGCIGELGWMQVKGIGGDIRDSDGRNLLEEASSHGHLLAQGRIVALELSRRPPFIKKVGLIIRRLVIASKAFLELYKNKNSEKVW